VESLAVSGFGRRIDWTYDINTCLSLWMGQLKELPFWVETTRHPPLAYTDGSLMPVECTISTKHGTIHPYQSRPIGGLEGVK